MNIYQTHDFKTVAKLNQSLQNMHAKWYPDFFKQYDYDAVEEFFKSIIKAENFTFFVLTEDSEPLGYAWIETRTYPETPFTKELNSVYVHQLGVIETHRGKGYGSCLMKEIYTFAKNAKIKLVELEYWAKNTRAKNFYQNQQFKQAREFAHRRL
ncbi:GNAT family N-acetyltransferase [Domibacillus iocasae]|uniref:GNAT family acetyltransferase n=1 Tax=Domibacillus iocasae TaxID=1714016 RepID=A0A1E7DUG6_9BACI|nr:GNAT family N-acetyltransferase [Domibacillus iocasae]OES46722.1 GNAT family acetyltransferase [Domibacillus iocasae]